MTFRENFKKYFVLYQGAIAFSAVEFSIIGNLHNDDKRIIDEFIKYPEDFETARKYVGGYFCEHTDIKGQNKTFRNYDFGPYPIDLLEFDDYSLISMENFKKDVHQMLSEYYDISSEIEFFYFINKTKALLEEIDSNSTSVYRLTPPEWKVNELGAFSLNSYLCGFSLNRIDKTITIIQIDDD